MDVGVVVVVVDGGSGDYTAAQAAAADRLLHAPRGRAAQMNRGAAAATGDVLLFLHADCRLETGALDEIETGLAGRGVAAGCSGISVKRYIRKIPFHPPQTK